MVGWWLGTIGAGLVGTTTFIGTSRALKQRFAARFPVAIAMGAPTVSFLAAAPPALAFYVYTPEVIQIIWNKLPVIPGSMNDPKLAKKNDTKDN